LNVPILTFTVLQEHEFLKKALSHVILNANR